MSLRKPKQIIGRRIQPRDKTKLCNIGVVVPVSNKNTKCNGITDCAIDFWAEWTDQAHIEFQNFPVCISCAYGNATRILPTHAGGIAKRMKYGQLRLDEQVAGIIIGLPPTDA